MKRIHFLIASYILLMIAGGLWGLREKVHASPAIFQELFPKKNIPDVSFFGSRMDRMKYGPKSDFWRCVLYNFPVNDFWHSSWYLMKTLYILGMWMAWKSKDVFWDFRNKLWPHLVWVTVITMFWGGLTNWLIEYILK